jgi:hypothetical protein
MCPFCVDHNAAPPGGYKSFFQSEYKNALTRRLQNYSNAPPRQVLVSASIFPIIAGCHDGVDALASF